VGRSDEKCRSVQYKGGERRESSESPKHAKLLGKGLIGLTGFHSTLLIAETYFAEIFYLSAGWIFCRDIFSDRGVSASLLNERVHSCKAVTVVEKNPSENFKQNKFQQ
jgi:hypothetical protein